MKIMERAALRVSDAANYLGIGRTKMNELIRDGLVEAPSVGGRRVVLRRSLDALLETKADEGNKPLRKYARNS